MSNPRKFFARLHWKVNGRLFGFGTSPDADWKIIFFSTIFLALVMIILSVLVFIRIDKKEVFTVNNSTIEGDKVLDISILKDTVSYYKNKAIEFERIKNTKPSAVDPSL